ncbi:hypothetical protein ACUODJ_35820, partial [Escherichia sp. HC-CC]
KARKRWEMMAQRMFFEARQQHLAQFRNAHRCLDWEPKIDMQETIDETLDFFLRTVDLTDKPS